MTNPPQRTDPTPIEGLPQAMKDRSHPSISTWNRLEGRPRTVDFARSLKTEVRDALWMLTRQWQLGEFRGQDAGSPVTVQYQLGTTKPTRFRPAGGQPIDLPDEAPLEAVAERCAVPFTIGPDAISYDLRLTMGRRWLRLLNRDPLLRLCRESYLALYPISAPDPKADADTARTANPEVWATMQAVAGRRMDGYLLYRHLVGGGQAADGVTGVIVPEEELNALGPRFVSWFQELISQPGAEGTAWDSRTLDHRFEIAAPTADGGELRLLADEYPGGHLDWFSFSLTKTGEPLGATSPEPDPLPSTVFPAPIRFSGMPLPRWWAVEDGRTNFAAVTPDSTDLARLIFLEFALVYSNDWFVVPCDLDAGTFAGVRGLAVTDVFGDRLWINPAGTGLEDDWQRWSMFTLDTAAGNTTTLASTDLLLPPTVPKVAEGPALEEVLLIRDENANMVWGIEKTVPQPTGDSRRGDEVAAETLAHRRLLHIPADPVEPAAPVAYQAMNTVPENWIPFIPVHLPHDTRRIQLRRASMPRVLDQRPPPPGTKPPAVKPRTSLLRDGLDTTPTHGYFVNEEEVPRAGTKLDLAYNRTRWYGGRVVVWLSARRGTGRGEGSSGLAFDALPDNPKPAAATE